MTWNYRVIKRTRNDYVSYEVCEVYYKADTIVNWSDGMALSGETLEELLEEVSKMHIACVKPVLVEQGDKLVEE